MKHLISNFLWITDVEIFDNVESTGQIFDNVESIGQIFDNVESIGQIFDNVESIVQIFEFTMTDISSSNVSFLGPNLPSCIFEMIPNT